MAGATDNGAHGARQRYWASTRCVTAVLVGAWLATTFGVVFYARELSSYTLFGWQFSYYMAAQGTTLIYLLIVGAYAGCMHLLDRRYRRRVQVQVQVQAQGQIRGESEGEHGI